MRGSVVALAVLLTAAAQTPQDPTPQTFRTGVDVVHVDVSVLDVDRRPVRGLTAADFTLLEDGKPRPIVAFTSVEIPVTPPPPDGAAAWVTDVAPDVASNDLPREGRLVVIMFDQSIRNAQQAVARRIAKAAVDALGPADLAAIVHTGAGRPHNFTRDRARLHSAIDAPMMGLVDGEELVDSNPTFRSESASAIAPSAQRGQCPLGKCTLEAITRIADSLRDLPRRKSLILIATRMTIQVRDDGPGDGEVRRLREKMFRALDVANLTIYPIDPLGLETLASDASRPSGTRPSPGEQLARRAGNLERQGNLMVLSDRTGGRTVVNSNDPNTVVPDIFAESRAYYSLGFESADRENKGRFHEIAVRVNRRDVSVHPRRGHYAGAVRIRYGSRHQGSAGRPGCGSLGGMAEGRRAPCDCGERVRRPVRTAAVRGDHGRRTRDTIDAQRPRRRVRRARVHRQPSLAGARLLGRRRRRFDDRSALPASARPGPLRDPRRRQW